jgi:hypothetical protein
MKRSLESVEEQTPAGVEASVLGAPQGANATKKAKLSQASEDTQAAAHSIISLSELPDLVLHQLVRFVHPCFLFICAFRNC